MKKIIIVEDMILLRDMIAKIINAQDDMMVAGVAAYADEAMGLCRKTDPDLALIDVVADGKAGGISAVAEIRRELPEIKIIMMTALPEITFINEAKKAGAHSFVYKNSDSDRLLYVIRSTLEGDGIYPGPGDELIARTRFSDEEIDVIRLVCQGKKRKEVASALNMSEANVKLLISGILNKTGFDSITKLSMYALARGLIVPGD
jgi:DNA-binding NarL/FixJ family response regulator